MAINRLRDRIQGAVQGNERLIFLCFAEFVFMAGFGLIVPILPRYAQSFGMSAAMVGVVIGIFGVARVIASMPAGMLSQRYGRRTVLVAGSLFMALGSLLCGLAGDVWQLSLYRFIAGIGSATFTTAAMSYIADISTPANRGRMMSAYQASLVIGVSFGPAAGGFIAALFGDRTAFYFVAAIAVGCALWCILRLPETVGKGAPALQKREIDRRQEVPKGATAWSILFNANFLLIGFVNFAIFFTRTGAEQSIVPLMAYNSLGLGSVEVGLGMTAIAVLNFVGTPLSGMAADRLGRKAAIVPGNLLAGVGLAMFMISSNYPLFVLSAAVTGLGKGLGGPAPAAYIADLAPKGMEGMTMGLYRTIADLGFVLGPILLGWIVDNSNFNWAMWFSAGSLFLSALMFAAFAQETLTRREPARRPLETSS